MVDLGPLIGFHFLERAPSCFHLIGLDFMVSTDWNVWFIEANAYPGSKIIGFMNDFHHKRNVSDMMNVAI